MGIKVKIGILGCADIAKRYAIKAFQSIPNTEVVSIASRDPEKAQKWATDFGIKNAELSYDDLIENKDIDAVYIPLPIGLHEEWVIKAASKGKHIISEKSLAGDFEAVKRIVSHCRSKGVVLYENFMCDFHPQHQKILSLIKDGRIGEPTVFRGYFGFPMMDKNNFRYNKNLGGSALNDAGAYVAFMARKIFDREPTSVYSNLFFDKINGIDMRGIAQLDFDSGVSAHLAFNFDAVYQNNYSVWGNKGLIHVNRAYSIPPSMKPEVLLISNENMKETKTDVDVPATNHFELIFSDFCETVLEIKNNKVKVDEIYEKIICQAKVLEAIRISSKEKRKVDISEIK